MNLSHNYILGASGVVSIYKRVNDEKQLIYATKNAILTPASAIIAKMMSGDTSAKPVKIEVFNGDTSKASEGFMTQEYDDTYDSVTYTCFFDEDSFEGALSKVRLSPADPEIHGYFSEANVVVNKSDTEQLIITWQIKFKS